MLKPRELLCFSKKHTAELVYVCIEFIQVFLFWCNFLSQKKNSAERCAKYKTIASDLLWHISGILRIIQIWVVVVVAVVFIQNLSAYFH